MNLLNLWSKHRYGCLSALFLVAGRQTSSTVRAFGPATASLASPRRPISIIQTPGGGSTMPSSSGGGSPALKAATASGAVGDYTILGKPNEFTASTSGVQLAVRRWVPPKQKPKAAILFVHGGAGWHSGYCEIMGKSMQKAGIAVVAFDCVGSGHSEGIKGLRNYFDSMDTLVNDVNMMLTKTREEFGPNTKVFCMGESFGCMVLGTQILKGQEKATGTLADGYILTGPVIKILPEMLPPKPVISVMGFAARFFPMLTMPGTDFFSTFDLAFGDKNWALAGRNDPIIQEAATLDPKLGMISSVLTSMNALNDKADEIDVPVKVMVGEFEGRVDVAATKRFVQLAKSSDKEFELVPGAYHQLFQDVPEVTQKVCESIQSWILARSS